MEIINKYFPNLTEQQRERFAALDELYRDWNSKINVISRKDIDNLYEHHILHSLGIAEIINFKPGTRIMDLGTGGGFPGIPLAIMFPEVQFHLVDSIGKKIRVCDEVRNALGLTNVTTEWTRGENIKEKYDFVVSRAVMPLTDFIEKVWTDTGYMQMLEADTSIESQTRIENIKELLNSAAEFEKSEDSAAIVADVFGRVLD